MEQQSPTKYEERLSLSREEIADRLHRIADQIARGTLTFGGAESAISDRAEYEIEFKADPRKRELEIEVKWG